MGLLDDAIREHLDLKRRRGADPEEIERMERDALGPVRRDPHAVPDAFESEVNDRYDDEFAGQAYDPPAELHSDLFDGDLDDSFDDQPTTIHQAESVEEDEHPTRRFGLFGRKHAAHDDDEPIEAEAHEWHHDDPFEPDPFGTQTEHESAGHVEDRPPEFDHRDDAPEPAEPEPAEKELPSPPKRPRFTDMPTQRASEPEVTSHDHEPEDDDIALHAADAAEDAPPHWDDKTQLFEPDELEDAPHTPEPGTSEHDVLEGTPDFLQDTPDHDRLWFEQKPPKDFDFGR